MLFVDLDLTLELIVLLSPWYHIKNNQIIFKNQERFEGGKIFVVQATLLFKQKTKWTKEWPRQQTLFRFFMWKFQSHRNPTHKLVAGHPTRQLSRDKTDAIVLQKITTYVCRNIPEQLGTPERHLLSWLPHSSSGPPSWWFWLTNHANRHE